MAARKKDEAAKDAAPAENKAAVEPSVAQQNVYRTDLGESLPPQKYAGVE